MAEKSLKELAGGVHVMAENSPKIQKDVELIRIAICGGDGIAESMVRLADAAEKLTKKGLSEKLAGNTRNIGGNLSKKISTNISTISSTLKDILSNMKGLGGRRGLERRTLNLKDLDKENKEKAGKLGQISKSIEIIERLRGINIKDFLFAKKKLKHISKIMNQSLNMFRSFKNAKEMEKTVEFINSSIDLVKKLAKTSIFAIPAKQGAKAIEEIYLGGKKTKGLLDIFRSLEKNKKTINTAKKLSKTVEGVCGRFLVTFVALSAMAILSPAALIGAVALRLTANLLVGTFNILSKSQKNIRKGSQSILMLGAGILAFSAGFLIMKKAVENVNLKDIGIMIAAIAGTALAVAGVGLLKSKIVKGSLSMIFMGAGLASFSLGFMALKKAASDLSLKQVGIMAAAIAGTGVAMAAIGLLSLPITLGCGVMLLMGASLGILGLALMGWEKFDPSKSIKNIETGIHGLKQAFGMESKNEDAGFLKNLGTVAGTTLNNFIGIIAGVGQFAQLAMIMGGVIVMDVIRLALIPWETYDSTKAVENITRNISIIKGAFFPPATDKNGNEKGFLGNLTSKLGAGLSGVIGVIGGAGQFAELATIAAAMLTMDAIRLALIPWETYDASKAIKNIGIASSGLKKTFGLTKENKKGKTKENIFIKLGTGLKGIFGAIGGLGQFAELSSIAAGMLTMDAIKAELTPWDNYDSSNAIKNIEATISSLKNTFGLTKENKKGKTKENIFIKLGTGLRGIIGAIGGLGQFAELSSIAAGMLIINEIRKSLTHWDKYDGKTAINNMKFVITSVKKIIKGENDSVSVKEMKSFKNITNTFKKGMINLERATENYRKVCSGIRSLYKTIENTPDNLIKKSTSISTSVDIIRDAFKKVNYFTLKKKSYVLERIINVMSKADIKREKTSTPIQKTVNAINLLDANKGKIMVDIFKSFSKIKDSQPLDKFTDAVEKFVDACNDVVDAVEKLDNVGREENTSNEENSKENISNLKADERNERSSENSKKSQATVSIDNISELANAISKALMGFQSSGDSGIKDINLIVDGVPGKKVILSLE